MWHRWLVVVVAALDLGAARANAAEVTWQAPDVCPDIAELRFQIERRIAMPLSHAASLQFRVTAAPARRGFSATVASEGGSAPRQRVLEASDCARLADLVAVTVALALGVASVDESDASGLDEANAANGSGLADGAAPATAASTNEAGAGATAALANASAGEGDRRAMEQTSEAPLRGDGWTRALSLWILADAGSLPRPGAGVAIGAQLERSAFQLRALGTLLFDQHAGLPAVGGVRPGADLGLVAGALSACISPFERGASGLAAVTCAGWELGRMSGQGTAVQQPREGSAWWSAPRIDAGASWAIRASGLELGIMLTLAAPLVREDFVLSELGSVHRPPVAVGRVALGLNWAPQ